MAKKKRIAHVVADKEGDMADLMQALGNAGGKDLATTREVNSWISRGHDVSQASKGKKNKRSKRTLLDDCSHPMLTVFYNKDKKEHYVALYDGDRIRTSSENSLDEGQVVPLEDLTALIDAEVLYRFKEMREQRKRIRRKKGKKPVGKEQDKPTIPGSTPLSAADKGEGLQPQESGLEQRIETPNLGDDQHYAGSGSRQGTGLPTNDQPTPDSTLPEQPTTPPEQTPPKKPQWYVDKIVVDYFVKNMDIIANEILAHLSEGEKISPTAIKNPRAIQQYLSKGLYDELTSGDEQVSVMFPRQLLAMIAKKADSDFDMHVKIFANSPPGRVLKNFPFEKYNGTKSKPRELHANDAIEIYKWAQENFPRDSGIPTSYYVAAIVHYHFKTHEQYKAICLRWNAMAKNADYVRGSEFYRQEIIPKFQEALTDDPKETDFLLQKLISDKLRKVIDRPELYDIRSIKKMGTGLLALDLLRKITESDSAPSESSIEMRITGPANHLARRYSEYNPVLTEIANGVYGSMDPIDLSTKENHAVFYKKIYEQLQLNDHMKMFQKLDETETVSDQYTRKIVKMWLLVNSAKYTSGDIEDMAADEPPYIFEEQTITVVKQRGKD